MIDFIKNLRDKADDKGVALPFIATMLVLLLGMTAFAVDLGWLYLNGSRVQRGADAAALAAVVHLPIDNAEVTAQAINGANANGWDIGSANGSPIPGGGPDSLEWQPLADNRLEVSVTATVPTFFLKVFGMDDLTMTRRATAEYIKPVPIGSPFNSFGDGNDSAQGFWAAVSGPYTARTNGDAHQSLCDWSYVLGSCMDSSMGNAFNWGPNPGTGTTNNPRIYPNDLDSNTEASHPGYRPDGYYYGIEIAEGTTNLNIDLFDPAFRRRPFFGNGNGCNTGFQTGDCDRLAWGPPLAEGHGTQGPRTHFQLYAPDSTPLDPRDNPIIPSCGRTFNPANSDQFPDGYNAWTDLCPDFTPTEGIYVLRVWTSTGSGSNHYGIRAQSSGPQAQVFGINDISIFANANNANLYLAEIDPVHAGKRLELRFYDAGEGASNAFMTVKMPDDSDADCTWQAHDQDNTEIAAQTSAATCRIQTTVNGSPRFNNSWITVEIDIPGGYTCDISTQLGCWWKMHMQLNTPHDRTTWTARIIGNPVRLVPNEP